MFLPRKQNRNEADRLLVPTEAVKFSRLSAKMVELSLQRGQMDAVLRDVLPGRLNTVSSPLPWPSTSTFAAPPHRPQPRGTTRESAMPKYWKEICCSLNHWFANALVSGAATVRKFCECAIAAEKKFSVWNSQGRVEIASRLWTSTGVAALAAVLAVGVISGVLRYAHSPHAAEHSGRNTLPVTPAMQNTSQPQSSSVVDTNGAAAAARHPRSSATGESRIRKIRIRKDDDYVAPDTYVYYGNRGKPAK